MKITMTSIPIADVLTAFKFHTYIIDPTIQAWAIETIFNHSCGNYIQLIQKNRQS